MILGNNWVSKEGVLKAKTLSDTTFSIILEYSLIPAFISHSKDTKNIFVFELPVFFLCICA